MSMFDRIIDGRYRLDIELGRGGFGAVYRAKQMAMGVELRDVALKLFHQEAVNSENVGEKMNDAIQLLRVISEFTDVTIAQHFINVYDLGVTRDENPQAFVAMELIRGGSLDHRIRDHAPFNTLATLQYLVQITRAIGFMHTMKTPMLHRDLKPDNLLIERRGNVDIVKVADFGLSRMVEDAQMTDAAGALEYMAPEGLEYNKAFPASDVYCIGLIACEMLFGKYPFTQLEKQSGTPAEMRQRRISARKAGVDLRPERGLDLPNHPKFQKVLEKMLAYDLDKRYASAQTVYQDLCRICDEDWPDGIFPRESLRGGDDAREQIGKEQRHVEFLLQEGKFGEAATAARSLCAAHPDCAEGYLAVSRVYRLQAERLNGKVQTAASREMFLMKAGQAVVDGLAKVAPAARPELFRAQAEVYVELGDHHGAATARANAIKERKGGGR